MEVSPNLIVDINTELDFIYTSNWQRVMKHAGAWSRIMKRRPGKGKRELITWLLDTGGIYPQGDGGNTRMDDMTAQTTEIDVSDFGAALELTSNEINDNQWAKDPSISAMDYAKKWARDHGAAAAYFPRGQLFTNLILAASGAGATTYDGLSFFNTGHPIDPSRTFLGTYSNIITGVDISAATGSINDVITAGENFSKALATIAGLTFTGAAIPRFLVPRIVVHPTNLTYRVRQLLGMGGGASGAEILSQTSNIFKDYNFEAPIEAPELNGSSPTTYYIGCEDILSDELGAFIMSEREAFEIQGYPDTASAAQNRQRVWQWLQHGRYGFLPGHPYLFFKCTT
jgi:hypothetical protein